MKASKNAIKIIKEFEGLRLKAYRDSIGLPTIGIGTIKYADGTPVKMGDTITEKQAEVLLLDHLEETEKFLNRVIKVPVTQNQFDSLLSLVYNIGQGNFSKSTLLRRLNARMYTVAAQQFDVWNKARIKGKLQPVKGLTIRRQKEKELFLTP